MELLLSFFILISNKASFRKGNNLERATETSLPRKMLLSCFTAINLTNDADKNTAEMIIKTAATRNTKTMRFILHLHLKPEFAVKAVTDIHLS